MERVFSSTSKEPGNKKTKIMMPQDNALENRSYDQNLCEKEELIGSVGAVQQDLEETKGISVETVGSSYDGEVSLSDSDKSKDVSVASDSLDGKEDAALSEEERKVVPFMSADSNNKESVLLEPKEQKVGSSLPYSRKKLLVLDLNGLLADIVGYIPKDFVPDTIIARRAIFKRPFCREFLFFCFDRFEVGIWSSRTQRNVERIVDYLLGDLKHKLVFCWDVSHCAKSTVGSLENKYKYVVFKELNQLWQKNEPNLPWEKGDYNQTNTLLLDDSPYKALLNPPGTSIFPQSYDFCDRTDNSLGESGDLRNYLEKLAEADNVQEFILKNPFGQEAITETSESWEFYRQIISKTCSSI